MKHQAKQKLSIVVPMFNEAPCIDAFFQRLLDVMASLKHTYEIICIDDGSTDATCEMIKPWISINPNIKIIRLTRNFGKERALAAGIDHATGDAVIPIDADLQDPPEVIPELLEKWLEGFKMVIAARSSRPGDTRFKRLSALSFYRIMNCFSEMVLPANAGDFRLMDRCVVDALKQLPERTRFHKGLFAWIGFETATVYYSRPERESGQTKWQYWKLWNYALEGIFSFSTAPLKLWTYVGVTTAFAGFIYAIYTVLRTLMLGIDVPGYASLLVILLILNGFCLIGIGVLGEYIGRIFIEVKQRPLYLIDSIQQNQDPVQVEPIRLLTPKHTHVNRKIN
jgi:glycosyltransferase involved in cell wall biosynthesis